MVRAGLGEKWSCVLANDSCGKKALTYQDNWGTGGELIVDDVASIANRKLALKADLAWGSFPCQDLSVAGNGEGLSAVRSGAYFGFWDAINSLSEKTALPALVVIENVCGLLHSNNGSDFTRLLMSFREHGYFAGGLVIDALEFLPQSRKRLFVIGVCHDLSVDPSHVLPAPSGAFFPKPLVKAFNALPLRDQDNWIWYNVAPPPYRKLTIAEILEPDDIVNWDESKRTDALVASTQRLFNIEALIERAGAG